MPSPLAHSASGYLIYRFINHKLSANRLRVLAIPLSLIIIIGFSLLPDLDIVPGILMGNVERFHNNASHSLIAGLLVSIIFSLIGSRILKSPLKPWFAAVLISYELHIIMDFLTGGRGVMLFWPITSARFISPVQLFVGVQWGNGLASIRHLETILTEALLFLFILICLKLVQRYKPKTPNPGLSSHNNPPS